MPPLSIPPHPWRIFIYKRKVLCGNFYAPYSVIDSFIYSPLQYPTTPTLTLCGVKGISPSVWRHDCRLMAYTPTLDDVFVSTLRLGLGEIGTVGLTSSAHDVMSADNSRCPGNCSGHGTCQDGQCLCLVSGTSLDRVKSLTVQRTIIRFFNFWAQTNFQFPEHDSDSSMNYILRFLTGL